MIKEWFRKWLGITVAAAPIEQAATPRKPMVIDPVAAHASKHVAGRLRRSTMADWSEWVRNAAPMKQALPKNVTPKLAMDEGMPAPGQFLNMMPWLDPELIFLGYPVLATMAQRVEYRLVCSAFAREMTREWIEFTAGGKKATGDKNPKVKKIEEAFKRFAVRELMGDQIEKEGYFGRCHLYVDMDTDKDADILPLLRTKETVKKGSLNGFRLIEPTFAYPSTYNATDPRKADFYRACEWYVMGNRVHADRMLTLITHPVPDWLKPMYSFGGISRVQLTKPYVDNWLRDRQSVSDAVHSFSVWAWKTNMDAVLEGGGLEAIQARAEIFNNMRDNAGVAMIDKELEEIVNISMPLGTLDALQSQSQEHVASFSGVPLVILFGITPSGLNASSDGEIRAWYDRITADQERDLRPILQAILELVQLNEFGEIDPEIGFQFVPLYQLDAVQLAAVRKSDAETAKSLSEMGALHPDDERERQSKDEQGLYHGMALSQPEPEDESDDEPPPDQ